MDALALTVYDESNRTKNVGSRFDANGKLLVVSRRRRTCGVDRRSDRHYLSRQLDASDVLMK
jgi:hypothetical protein